ncbi:MAG: hypothetical protein WD847_01865 [Pirellulales bacterium]
MSVQFACTHCRKRLKISSRKVGTTIHCPKCGAASVVPDEYTAAAEAAMAVLAGPDPGSTATAIPEAVVYDDIPDLFAERPESPPRVARVSPGIGGPRGGVGGVGSPQAGGRPRPSQALPAGAPKLSARTPAVAEPVLLVSRRAVYAQAGLFCLVAVAAFAAGYAIAPGDGQKSREQRVAEAIMVRGNVVYRQAANRLQPDGDAVVVALPRTKQPQIKLASSGLRPGEFDQPAGRDAQEMLASLGGAAASTDGAGEFQLVLPHPGDYYVLFISRHAKRAAGQLPAAADLQEMADYFQSPAELIADKQYEWSARGLSADQPPLTQEFR